MKIELLDPEKTGPYYVLIIYYMIGDANGHTQYNIKFDKLNPSIERLLTSLIKLGDYHPKGHWGWIFDSEHYRLAIKDGVLTDEDVEAFKIENEELESWEVIRNEIEEYTFLVYQGYKVSFIDEKGITYPCKVIL